MSAREALTTSARGALLADSPRRPAMFEPYPLLMAPKLAPKVWGGARLAREIHPELVAQLNGSFPSAPLGEAWELADHPHGESFIANGPLAGRSFSAVIAEFALELAGRPLSGRYPLMVKIIDAADDLSVQVHPDDALAERLGTGDRGKSEFWFVMDRDAGARVLYGLKEGVGEAELRAALESGRVDDVAEYLDLEPGLCLDVPAGTVHALLRGTLVCEIQQSSDTTFRLHDWNRQPPRELHLEHGLLAANFRARGNGERVRRLSALPLESGVATERVVSNDFFSVDVWRLRGKASVALGGGPSESILVATGGRGVLRGRSLDQEILLKPGATVFLPASSPGEATVEPLAGAELTLLLAKPRFLGE